MAIAPRVTIIGAGIIGSSIAWRLSQAGVPVRLLDARQMGGEASWASAGMLAPGGEIQQRSWWSDLAIESLGLYPAFVEELSAESGVAIDYRLCGAYELPGTAADWPGLRERAALQHSFGIACREEEGRVHYPDDAIVNPRDVIAALRLACLRRGVEIIENMPVIRFEAGPEPLVVAAGAWSSQLQILSGGQPLSLPETYPVKGHLLGFNLPAGSLGPILRSGHTYILQRANGFTVAGSDEQDAGFDRTIDSRACADLAHRAASLWPELAGRTPDETWMGFRPASRTGEPVIGRQPDTAVWLAYGHYRNGVLMAPATARRIASEIAPSAG